MSNDLDKKTICFLLESIYIEMIQKEYPDFDKTNPYFYAEWYLSNDYDKKISLLKEALNNKTIVASLGEQSGWIYPDDIEEVHIEL